MVVEHEENIPEVFSVAEKGDEVQLEAKGASEEPPSTSMVMGLLALLLGWLCFAGFRYFMVYFLVASLFSSRAGQDYLEPSGVFIFWSVELR